MKLTRTEALNALTHKMILALDRALQTWEEDPEVACVILEGEGRAFCAGGDVVAAYKAGRSGTPAYEFFVTNIGSMPGSDVFRSPISRSLTGSSWAAVRVFPFMVRIAS